MSDNPIDSVKATPEPAAAKPKRKAGKKAKAAKKAGRAKKAAAKLKADRTNKKAEVIEMMKRARSGNSTGSLLALNGLVSALPVKQENNRELAFLVTNLRAAAHRNNRGGTGMWLQKDGDALAACAEPDHRLWNPPCSVPVISAQCSP
jgi:hypothetical protein